MATTKRTPLSRARILDAAIALADESGIESLSMRKLAQALGVEAMSLYNHVANKSDLLDAIVDRVVSEIELPSDGDWATAIRRCAISAHDAFLRHPWACGLAMAPAGGLPTEPNARMRYLEWLLRRLREAGFSADLAFHAYHTIDSHILGFTLWQLGHGIRQEEAVEFVETRLEDYLGGAFPYLLEHARQHLTASSGEGQREFEFGLDLILEGLQRALERTG